MMGSATSVNGTFRISRDALLESVMRSKADGFGLMCIHYDQPDRARPPRERYRSPSRSGSSSWQSA
jgi:hypothetical protein